MTAVLQQMPGLALDGGIMAPSPVSPGAARHGRSKHGGSVVKKTRGRGYSVVDDREVTISKAISFVLKRTTEEGEEEEEGKLVASDGWVDCEDVLQHPNMAALEVTLSELLAVVESSASKARFAVRRDPDAAAETTDPSDYEIRLAPIMTPTSSSPTADSAADKFTPLTTSSADLPDMIVYETSYPNYPLVLASGGIKRAGGQAVLQFKSIKVDEDGNEIRAASTADVSIQINLREIMEADDKIRWARAENGNIVTEGDAKGSIPKEFWAKAVARRADIGVLFENGEVRKEIPIGLRGKGVKGKKGSGKGKGWVSKEMKASSEDDGSSSD
ncbi:putative tRNA 2'-phosphotransferase 1 [Coleophoma cylindrospora]|uniref:2'-phosphotransferase n=1 Tax=Coleophoma cylindrospora TaxID=1849047 RepID=A0A3D8S127_9HELO|nr:putative tRNA 2'-phosphotransferase 1 [Coleophoma cylindrospora]